MNDDMTHNSIPVPGDDAEAQDFVPVWQGELEVLPGAKSLSLPADLPRVNIGQPEIWTARAKFGPAWVAPAGDCEFHVMRFAVNLAPRNRQVIAEAILTARLSCDARTRTPPIAYDLFPRETLTERQRNLTFSLGPDLKFTSQVSVSLGKVELKVPLKSVAASVRAFGLGQSVAYWRYEHQNEQPLAGVRETWMVVKSAASATNVRVSLQLEAAIQSALGPLRLGIPQQEQAALSWLLA
jgi:hypothetical protein